MFLKIIRSLPALALMLIFTSNAQAKSVSDLACEAVLCLSSSYTPTECNPSLKHYYDIRVYRKGVFNWARTLNARKAFLNLCVPVTLKTETADMPKLIDDIVNAVERCSATQLNSRLREIRTKRVCNYVGGDAGEVCSSVQYYVVSDKKPNYCSAYESNELTDIIPTHYVGDPENGGRWVEGKVN